MSIAVIARSMRLPFLVLTPVCVFLGASTAVSSQIEVNFLYLGLALGGAVCAHIGVNSLNEYFDFDSGLDLKTIRTPFSGGSGALPEYPGMSRAVLATSITSICVTILVGVYFIWLYGPTIALIGIAGLFLIVTYTGWINRYPFLCLIAPGMGFGVLMVIGSQYVLAGYSIPLAWIAAAVPFFLVNNLLLLNQYPDIAADASVGRRTFPVVYGIKQSNVVYGAFIAATIVVIITGVSASYFPVFSLLALVSLIPALFSLHGAIRYKERIGQTPVYLAANVVTAVFTPLLLGLSLVFSNP